MPTLSPTVATVDALLKQAATKVMKARDLLAGDIGEEAADRAVDRSLAYHIIIARAELPTRRKGARHE